MSAAASLSGVSMSVGQMEMSWKQYILLKKKNKFKKISTQKGRKDIAALAFIGVCGKKSLNNLYTVDINDKLEGGRVVGGRVR